jgi:hypothetical protein
MFPDPTVVCCDVLFPIWDGDNASQSNFDCQNLRHQDLTLLRMHQNAWLKYLLKHPLRTHYSIKSKIKNGFRLTIIELCLSPLV